MLEGTDIEQRKTSAMILTLAALALIAALHYGLPHVASSRPQPQRAVARVRPSRQGLPRHR